MRTDWEIARRSFRRRLTYRAATAAGVFTNTVFGVIRAEVMLAAIAARGGRPVGGLDATDLVTFTFVSQGMLLLVGAFGERELAEKVQRGDIAVDLLRPHPLLRTLAAEHAGRSLHAALFRGIPPFLLGGLLFDLRTPGDVTTAVAFVLTTTLGTIAAFAFWTTVQLSAFWLTEIRGPIQLASLVVFFGSGATVPLQFFPGVVGTIVRNGPFAAMVQLPAEVFLGHVAGSALVGVVVRQLLWVALLLVAARVTLAAALRKLVVQGG